MKKSILLIMSMLLILCFSLVAVACNDTETVSFKLQFDANGGNGTMQTMTFNEGEEKTLTANVFSRKNYSFAGWATTSGGQVVYHNCEKISIAGDTILYAVWTRNEMTVNVVANQKPNTQTVQIAWSESSENLTKIELKAYHGNDLAISKTITDESELIGGKTDLDVFYGKFNVEVKLFGSDNLFVEYKNQVNVLADSYNIAYLYGTFPVSIFTLQMMDKDSSDLESTKETFVHLSGRYKAYDWDKLPENMKPLPVAMPGTDGTEPHSNTAKWIKELYDMNNNAHFTFYFNDVYIEMLGAFFIENGIPVQNWDAIMYSDGTATANYITEVYNCQNPVSKYNEMATAWNAYVNRTITDRNSLPYNGGWNIPYYAYVVCNEMDNVKWYTGRLRTTENVILQDTAFANTIVNGSKEKGRKEFYLNNLLDALTPEEKVIFKNLYHIDESTFAEAKKENKKVMMILGTAWSAERDNLEDYLRITMEVYGDEYIYYYKGHPGYPTSSYAERGNILTSLKNEGYKLFEIDNSIAAEFFLFFFNDIEMIGYPSTTFESGTDANANGVFGQTINSGYYAELLETYINKINDIDAFNDMYSSKNITLDNNKDYYLIEFQRGMANNKDIAIFDVESKDIKYYRLVDGQYQII